MRDVAALTTAALLLSCAAPASRPHEMSASDHDRRAAWLEDMAASRGPGKEADQTAFLQRLAIDHRRAARTLREAEATACAGLRPEERAVEPFSPARIMAIEPLDGAASGDRNGPGPHGALVRLFPLEGETADVLKARIECAMARDVAHGTEPRKSERLPFSAVRTSVLVRSQPDGPIVEFRTGDQRDAKVLLDALHRFATRG